jgi:hypothetical protein
MITHSMLIPDGLEWRFGEIGFVEQIPRAQTHEGRARDHTVGVQNTSRPECLRDSLQLLVHIFLRDLVKVSADDHVCPPIEATRDEFRETLPVTAWKLLEGHNWYDRIRVGCHKADERFKVELLKEGQRDHWVRRESSHRGNPLQYPGGK